MRCTIPLPALLHLLRDCVSLIPARTTMPITGHLLLSATDDHITITTTNLETTVIAQCPASVSEAGTVTLPGKKLYEILKATAVTFQCCCKGFRVVAESDFLA